MKKLSVNKIEVKLSPKQEILANLYLQAKGKVVYWVKKNSTKVLNPDEVIIVEGKIS